MNQPTTNSTLTRQRRAIAAARRRARSLAAKGNVSGAIRLLQSALEPPLESRDESLHRVLARALVTLGSCCIEAGRMDEGMTHLRRAIELHPRNADAYCALAYACEQRGLPDVAVEMLREAARANPRCASAYRSLGGYYLAQQRFEDAIAAYDQALALEPDYEPAYAGMALASEGAGDLARAVAALQQAVHLNPFNLDYRLGLARDLASQGFLHGAASTLREAAQLFPDSADVHHALGEICSELGDYDGMIEEGAALRALSPKNPAAYELLASGHFQSGRAIEAIDAVRRLVGLEPHEAHHHLKMGILLQHLGRLGPALEEFMRASSMSSECDGETACAAQEAIVNLDDVQVRQILLRAAEDQVFRVKLARDPAATAFTYGFRLSPAAVSALMSMDFEPDHDPDQERRQTYH